MIRNNVSFRHPAAFVRLSEEDGILAASGAIWFRDLLKRVPSLEVNDELCQEEWGVVVFVERHQKRFWIGLSLGLDVEDGSRLAHIHHASFAWLQRLSSGGRKELQRLIGDVHALLAAEPAVSDIRWFREADMRRPEPPGLSSPDKP